MQTQAVEATNGNAGRSNAPQRLRGENLGWHSHTFSDGTRSIAPAAPLDARTVRRLRSRLRQLRERGCDRLIVDLSAAVDSSDEATRLLAEILQVEMPRCEVVAVIPRDCSLDANLPARVAAAWSLSDARMLLATHPRRAGRKKSGPGSTISADDRHVLAVRQVLRWAAQTAGAGDFENALRALTTIERVEGQLPLDWQERREAWLAASQA
ncbi:MAG TPA: hypothetical protein VGO48_15870 [Conexibacter sp.]|nr:hypothetical protein [Conexibacter sp.]